LRAGLVDKPLKVVMLERLLASGTWMNREQLAEGASSSPAAIDDALADLVLEKKADYRQGVGYRLAGGQMAREAGKVLARDGTHRAMAGATVKDEYRVGVAQRTAALGVVMFELALPKARTLDEQLLQVQALGGFLTKGLS
jgi:hypothetical protein